MAMRRLFGLCLTLALLAGAAPVLAQTDTGEIDIVVQDAASKAPVVLARVLLDGPVITSEFTGDNGRVRFTEVPDGVYRARVFARGFQAVTSENFEVTNGRMVTVTVALAQSTGNLKTIASVVAKSTANVSTTTIDENSTQRRLSDTLADALGKLSGVNVSTSSNDTDATQTVSLEGQDASQTALTLDGIPLNAPGSAGDLRGIGTDLFTRSNVSFGPQIGGLAGGVNFSTLQPTLSWNSEFSLSVGSNGKNNYSFGESGTLGKVGLAVMRTYRLTPSLLDGMSFLDTSGLNYVHDGDGQSAGTMLKLRYQPSESQTLTGTFMKTANGSQLVCAQITGPLPCGYGPNNSYDTNFKLFSLSDDALVGDTQVQASVYGLRMASTRDELDRYVNGVAEPTGTSQSMSTNGLTFSAILPARDRHTISINGYETSSDSAFTPLVAQAAPYVVPGQHVSYAAVTVNDSIRSNTKLRFNDSIGISRASNAPASLLVGFGTQWNPTADDGFAFTYNIGGTAAHAGRFGVLSDPAQLRIDCNGDVAYGNAPGDEPGASSSNSARLSYTHKMRAGLISTQVYRQVQHDVVLPTQVNGSVLSGMGAFPPDYFGQVQQTYQNACGTAAPFGPVNTYFQTPIGNVQRVYEGAQISAFYTLGPVVIEPYYNVQVAKALSGDVRLNNPYSITIPAAQPAQRSAPPRRNHGRLQGAAFCVRMAGRCKLHRRQQFPKSAGVHDRRRGRRRAFAARRFGFCRQQRVQHVRRRVRRLAVGSPVHDLGRHADRNDRASEPASAILGDVHRALRARRGAKRQLGRAAAFPARAGRPGRLARARIPAIRRSASTEPAGRSVRAQRHAHVHGGGAKSRSAHSERPQKLRSANQRAQGRARLSRRGSAGRHPGIERAVSRAGFDVRAHRYAHADGADALAVRLHDAPYCRPADGPAAQPLRAAQLERHVLPACSDVHALGGSVFRSAASAAGHAEFPSVQTARCCAEHAVCAARRFDYVYGGHARRSANRPCAAPGALCRQCACARVDDRFACGKGRDVVFARTGRHRDGSRAAQLRTRCRRESSGAVGVGMGWRTSADAELRARAGTVRYDGHAGRRSAPVRIAQSRAVAESRSDLPPR